MGKWWLTSNVLRRCLPHAIRHRLDDECGTVACVAGHVAALVDADPGIDCGLTSVGIQGAALPQRVTSAQLAQVALGIDDDDAAALFDCDATREYVTAALETIAAG